MKEQVDFLTVQDFSEIMMDLIGIASRLKAVDPDLTVEARRALTAAWGAVYDLREIAKDIEAAKAAALRAALQADVDSASLEELQAAQEVFMQLFERD